MASSAKITKPIVPYSLDDYFQTTPIGSLNRAIGNHLYGINHRQTPNAVPSNKDIYGYTFVVRPQLNFQSDNIRNVRQLSSLLNSNPSSIQSYVRCMLDARIQTGYKLHKNSKGSVAAFNNPFVDMQMAFIPVITNSLVSVSGWPDITPHVHTSPAGNYKETHSMIDGVSRNFEEYDLDLTFQNMRGDTLLYMFYCWLMYGSNVFEGKLIPYTDFMAEMEIDYQTRVYRLAMDQHKRKVTKIAATGISIPYTCPMGSFFDYNRDKPYNDQNKEFTIRFKCNGVEYYDDILIWEFNQTVIQFNYAMTDGVRESRMVKVPEYLLGLFNNRGYPRINPGDSVLEWWVSGELFSTKTQEYRDFGLLTGFAADQDTFRGD